MNGRSWGRARRLPIWQLVGLWILTLSGGLKAAPDVTLAWDPSPDSEVSGYKLHYGLTSGAYDQVLDIGNSTTAVVSGLAAGQTFYFVVTAYNDQGIESLPSNEISVTLTTPQPASLNIQVLDPTDPDFPEGVIGPVGGNPAILIGLTRRSEEAGFEFTVKSAQGGTVTIQRSTDLMDWEPLGYVPSPTGGIRVSIMESPEFGRRFYRAVVE
jgi:hypothetical protein